MRTIRPGDTGRGPNAPEIIGTEQPFYARGPPLLFSIEDARRELGDIGKTTIFAMISAGQIEAVKVGRRTMVVGESCRAYVESLRRVKQAEAA